MLCAFKERYTRECKRSGTAPAVSVTRVLDAGATDRKFNVARTTISTAQLCCVARALATDTHFVDVDMEDVQLEDDTMVALAGALQRNATIRRLNLSSNNLRDSGCLALGELLKCNTPLQELSLSWNTLGVLDNGVQYIASALVANDHLETLVLANCQIGHVSGQALASALMANAGLRVLDVRWNNLGSVGGKALLRALEYNTTLQHLKLDGNHIPCTILDAVEARTASNRTAASARAAEQARAQLMARELEDLTRRSHAQVSVLQRENEALATDASNNRALVGVLRETLGDSTTTAETLETRLDLCTRELACKDRELQTLMASHVRLRDEYATQRAEWAADLGAVRTARDRSEKDLRAVTDAKQHEAHAFQQQHQELLASVELLRADLRRAQDELAAERQRCDSEAGSAARQLASARQLHEERLQAERARADADIRNMHDRLRAAQSLVDQARAEATARVAEVKQTMEDNYKQATAGLQAEQQQRLQDWERRYALAVSAQSTADATCTAQKQQLRALEAQLSQAAQEREGLLSRAAEKENTMEREVGRLGADLAAAHQRAAAQGEREKQLLSEVASLTAKLEHERSLFSERKEAFEVRVSHLDVVAGCVCVLCTDVLRGVCVSERCLVCVRVHVSVRCALCVRVRVCVCADVPWGCSKHWLPRTGRFLGCSSTSSQSVTSGLPCATPNCGA
eukprot:m.428346 g.428346  ORF g.428346 m.428346 type:complete len:692 (-) comp21377_c1_seq9:468-2543(-)